MENKENYTKNVYIKVAKKDDSSDNLVGIRITKSEKGEKLTVIFPIGYNIKTKNEETNYSYEYKRDVKSLIQCLSLKLNNDETENEKKFSFISAIQLIQDFQTIGLYKESSTEENIEASGKINWKKTINETTNKMFWNRTRFLPEIFYKKTNYNYEGKIQQIQKYCLGFVSMVIGVFYNFNYPKFQKPGSDAEMIKALNEEIQNTNVDSNKMALIHLKSFIENSNCINIDTNSNQILEFGTKKFHTIWERIVDKRFGGIKDLRKYNPKAIYLNNRLELMNDIQHRVEPSRPDTIIDYRKDLGLIILDAKYYKIGNLPGEYDINKQLRYAEYCAKQYSKKIRRVYNIFILPKQMEEEKFYEIESYATNEAFYTDDDRYGKAIDGRKIVAVCYVDTKKLLTSPDSFVKEKLDNIVNEIEETYNKAEANENSIKASNLTTLQ